MSQFTDTLHEDEGGTLLGNVCRKLPNHKPHGVKTE